MIDQRLALEACTPQIAPPRAPPPPTDLPEPHPQKPLPIPPPPPPGGLRPAVSGGVVGVHNRGVAPPHGNFVRKEMDGTPLGRFGSLICIKLN